MGASQLRVATLNTSITADIPTRRTAGEKDETAGCRCCQVRARLREVHRGKGEQRIGARRENVVRGEEKQNDAESKEIDQWTSSASKNANLHLIQDEVEEKPSDIFRIVALYYSV